jgi:ribosomal protein L7/L12
MNIMRFFLNALTVAEAAELNRLLEEKWRISMASPVVIASVDRVHRSMV